MSRNNMQDVWLVSSEEERSSDSEDEDGDNNNNNRRSKKRKVDKIDWDKVPHLKF